jgi:hypothetical protein
VQDLEESSDLASPKSGSIASPKAQRQRRKKPKPFKWKLERRPKPFGKQRGDGNVSDEDMENGPDAVELHYSRLSLSLPLPALSDLIYVRKLARESARNVDMLEYFEDVRHLCSYVERWELFENALRFHRFAHRAFFNLRAYAFYKSRARAHITRRKMEVKRQIFGVFREIYEKIGKAEYKDMIESERQVLQVRSHIVMKMLRMRGASEYVKEHISRGHDDDDVDEEELQVWLILVYFRSLPVAFDLPLTFLSFLSFLLLCLFFHRF